MERKRERRDFDGALQDRHKDVNDDVVAQWSRNPLLCWLCDSVYDDPRLLNCYHAFCARCLAPRVLDSRIFCPLCCKVTVTKDAQLPPRDNLMVFLVDSSCEERPPCANCDNGNQADFFCNTCGQALCCHCREETHRARMFSTHDVIHMSKRGREVSKKCPLHGEPYIMFSATKHTMLCINCFRESSVDARLHCTDLETAYTMGCKKLERGVMSIRELQNSVRDGVILFKALLDELRKNMETERNNISTLADTIQDSVRRIQEALLKEVATQYESKDKLFRAQLSSLGSLLPIIQVHLLMCTTFASSASKCEFLDLVFLLMERLAAIAHLSHPLRPGQSSQIRSNYRSEFCRGLEGLLSSSGNKAREASAATAMSSSSLGSEKPQSTDGGFPSRPPSSSSVGGQQQGGAVVLGLPTSHPALSAAKLKISDGVGPFAEHCKAHDGRFRELSNKFTRLKEEAQELHRDVTLRRCMTRHGRVEEIVRESAALDDEVRCYGDEVEELRAAFDAAWDEQIQRVYAEQEVFQSQVNDIASLKDENKRLMIIAQQLEPYIRSITALMERISPKLQVPATRMLSSSQICMLESRDADSQVMQQIIDQINSCAKMNGARMDGRGCGDGATRGGAGAQEERFLPGPPQGGVTGGSSRYPDGIPSPPDPPHMRRGLQQAEKDAGAEKYGFPTGPGSVPSDGGATMIGTHRPASHPQQFRPHRRGQQQQQQTHEADKTAGSLSSSVVSLEESSTKANGSKHNCDPEAQAWRERATKSLPLRRSSEGSDVDVKRALLNKVLRKGEFHHYENSVARHTVIRSLSEERQKRIKNQDNLGKIETAERLLKQAVASFDASAIPERPKSACENVYLCQVEHLYGLGTEMQPVKQSRKSDEGIYNGRAGSRSSSAGRTRSAERGSSRGKITSEPNTLRAKGDVISYHQDKRGLATLVIKDNAYAVAVASSQGPVGKKENIYENVVHFKNSLERGGLVAATARALFKKQNSLDTIPTLFRKERSNVSSEAATYERREALRKADSFEGHEEAVRTLVAQVHKNRIFRRKESKLYD